ncbi:MAG: AAA family ATPase [Euryarchaeota archaeon]|nr:AAA family ATPase [Euryarchaeota archaeon]MVT14694.1 AAA family ATPase [Euryarchaeota archaeon]MVT35934.1 AAA family ATPase [Euryarchaeota archaeon]
MVIKMIFSFIGKGGVGKTTISSAFAIEMASRGKVALLSMDEIPMTHEIFKEKEKNIDIYEYKEIDAQREWKEKYGEEVYSLISSFFDLDRSIIEHIAKAPGISDEFMLAKLLELKDNYDFIVWDTAASSSTMHLLLLEKDFYEHINSDIKFYFEIKDTLSKIMRRNVNPLEILNKWKKLAQDVWDLLSKETFFFIVKTDDDLSYIQGDIIEKELNSMGLKIYKHILNRWKGKYDAPIKIPELTGNPREIVEMVRPFLREVHI